MHAHFFYEIQLKSGRFIFLSSFPIMLDTAPAYLWFQRRANDVIPCILKKERMLAGIEHESHCNEVNETQLCKTQ